MSAVSPMLASGGLGPLVPVLFFLTIGLFKWLGGRLSQAPPPPPRRDTRPAAQTPQRGSNDEQMRKFLEALGVPTEGASPPPPPPAHAHARPPIVERHPTRPMPGQPRTSAQRQHSQPPPMPAARKPVAPPAPVSIEQIENPHLGELKTPDMPEFKTKTSSVSAIPYETGTSLPISAAEVAAAKIDAVAAPAEAVRVLLSSNGGLRSAFLLREILGAPRGLQSRGFTPSFASL